MSTAANVNSNKLKIKRVYQKFENFSKTHDIVRLRQQTRHVINTRQNGGTHYCLIGYVFNR